MPSNNRIPFKNSAISSDRVPAATAAGGHSGDALRDGGLNAVNLWGTGGGIGVPAGRAMLALDGVFVLPVNVTTTALKENDPVYITSANVLNNTASGNTLFGYADEPAAVGNNVKIGVRVSNAIGA